MQGKNVIYFNVHIYYDGRKEDIMGINTDKKRLSQAQNLQNVQSTQKFNEMLTVYQEYEEGI